MFRKLLQWLTGYCAHDRCSWPMRSKKGTYMRCLRCGKALRCDLFEDDPGPRYTMTAKVVTGKIVTRQKSKPAQEKGKENVVSISNGRGRPRVYASAAERQKAYRERKKSVTPGNNSSHNTSPEEDEQCKS